MQGYLVRFEYGACPGRTPLKALGVVDYVRCFKGQTYWHILPVVWEIDRSPLPRWVEAGSVAVLNANAPVFAEA